jgi:hypothetical protein
MDFNENGNIANDTVRVFLCKARSPSSSLPRIFVNYNTNFSSQSLIRMYYFL